MMIGLRKPSIGIHSKINDTRLMRKLRRSVKIYNPTGFGCYSGAIVLGAPPWPRLEWIALARFLSRTSFLARPFLLDDSKASHCIHKYTQHDYTAANPS
jgi:hypothetical protein